MRILPLATFFNIVLEILTTAIRQEKKLKASKLLRSKIVNICRCNNSNIENPIDSTRKTIRMNEFSNFMDIKLTYINQLHFYTLIMN